MAATSKTSKRVVTVNEAAEWGYALPSDVRIIGKNLTDEKVKQVVGSCVGFSNALIPFLNTTERTTSSAISATILHMKQCGEEPSIIQARLKLIQQSSEELLKLMKEENIQVALRRLPPNGLNLLDLLHTPK